MLCEETKYFIQKKRKSEVKKNNNVAHTIRKIQKTKLKTKNKTEKNTNNTSTKCKKQ